MLTGMPLLEQTDWSSLHHAYGRATDTPDHLRALLAEEVEPRQKALSHLWSAVIHQGTPWTATGPAALVVAGILSDDRIDRGPLPIRANLLSFLAAVAEAPEQAGLSVEELERMAGYDIDALVHLGDDEALYGNEAAAESFYARSLLGCIRAAPVLMRVMLEGLANDDPGARACAAMGAVALVKTASFHDRREELAARLMTLAEVATDSDERSAHVLALGDLGASPAAFLKDPSPAVRMCAALAPALEGQAEATAELLDALERHAESIDGWFVVKPPQFSTRPRFAAVARLIERVKDFERLAAAAEAVVRVTSIYCVDFDWGPLLAAAFPGGKGVVETEAQRRLLAAVVGNAELWDPKSGNAGLWFKRAGLPYDRGACKKRVEDSQWARKAT